MSRIGDKIKYTIQNTKRHLIIIAVVWVIYIVLILMPFTIGLHASHIQNDKTPLFNFMVNFHQNFTKVPDNIGKMFTQEYFDLYMSVLLNGSILYFIIMGFAVYHSKKKHSYDEIEHGSSEWSTKHEMYKVLSKEKGILLADQIYLPTNKPGNINVLVVGGSGSRKIYILCFP